MSCIQSKHELKKLAIEAMTGGNDSEPQAFDVDGIVSDVESYGNAHYPDGWCFDDLDVDVFQAIVEKHNLNAISWGIHQLELALIPFDCVADTCTTPDDVLHVTLLNCHVLRICFEDVDITGDHAGEHWVCVIDSESSEFEEFCVDGLTAEQCAAEIVPDSRKSFE